MYNTKIKHVLVEEKEGLYKVLSACYTDNLGTATGFIPVISQEDYPIEIPENMQPVQCFDIDLKHIYYVLEEKSEEKE